MKYVLLLIVALLPGCSTVFDNRIACTVGNDKAFFVSEYGGRIGIASSISEKDRPHICK